MINPELSVILSVIVCMPEIYDELNIWLNEVAELSDPENVSNTKSSTNQTTVETHQISENIIILCRCSEHLCRQNGQ